LPRQPSRVTTAKAIKAALDLGQISVTDTLSAPVISEYDDGNTTYRIRDVLDILHAVGRLSDSEYPAALRAAHKPAQGGSVLPPLKSGDAVVVQLMTLETLTELGQLAGLLQTFQIAIPASDRVELDGELRASKAQEEVWQWHNDLWEIVR